MQFACAMNNAQSADTNVVEAMEAPTVVKCRYCNREGHSRSRHFNRTMNPAFSLMASLITALLEIITYKNMKGMA